MSLKASQTSNFSISSLQLSHDTWARLKMDETELLISDRVISCFLPCGGRD
jgi:hypothetical protein